MVSWFLISRPLSRYTVEILPFALRAKGFTVFNFALTLSLIFNQYVNPIALEAYVPKFLSSSGHISKLIIHLRPQAWMEILRSFIPASTFATTVAKLELTNSSPTARLRMLVSLRDRLHLPLPRRNQERTSLPSRF